MHSNNALKYAVPSLLFALITMLICSSGMSQEATTQISRAPLTIDVGTRLQFESTSTVYQFAPPVREDFYVRIAEKWPGGIAFQYSNEQKLMGIEQGVESLSSLDDCKTLDPWWDPAEISHDDRCNLWLPRQAFLELITTHKTWLAIDTLARQDSTVRWEYQGIVWFFVYSDGSPALLRGIQVKTTRNDELVILDDIDNPLILSAKSTFFSWTLIRVNH